MHSLCALEENNQLRSQLGQPENTRTTTTVSAEVIARSPGDWADTLTLDKGSSSGVNKDDLVTTVDGMLGFVSEVTDNTCEVTSITDPKMQCGALVTRTRETAIAEGDYNLMTRGALRLSYLREDSKVVVGDTVETSGRGGVFPKGILSRRKAVCRITRSSSRLSAWTAFPRFPSSPNTRTQRSKPCRENIFPSRS